MDVVDREESKETEVCVWGGKTFYLNGSTHTFLSSVPEGPEIYSLGVQRVSVRCAYSLKNSQWL